MTSGGVLGIAALSGPVDAAALAAGRETLEGWGYRTRCAANLGAGGGSLFAGDDRQRLEAFHALLEDPEVEAVVFARGGHGSLRLLPYLDWRRIALRPRAFVGYSDVTPFLLEVVARLGWISFHGPMAAVDLARGLDADEERSLRSVFEGCWSCEVPVRVLERPPRAGSRISGTLSGGCLSLLCGLMGTPYAPRFATDLLLLEDVGEPVYRLDRMLAQLHVAGALRGLAAVLAGQFEPMEEDEVAAWHALLSEWAAREGAAACCGVPMGHGRPNLTYGLGAPAVLDLEAQLLRAGVSA